MRIKATIKCTFKAILAQWKQIILVYALFPLLLASIMGYFQKDIFKPDTSIEKINISIEDKDNSNISKDLTDVLSSEELKNIFNISDNGDYLIKIPEGYEQNLLNSKETTITVEEKKRISRNNEVIIKTIIDEYGKNLTESLIIANNIDYENNQKLIKEISKKIEYINSTTSLKANIVDGKKVLTSFENQAASMMTFMIFTIIMGCVAGYHLDKENGSFKRLMSTAITRRTFFNLDLLIFFLSSFVYGLVYIIAFRITGLAFKGLNPINIIILLTVQSILVTAIAGLIISFFKKKTSNIIIIVFMYFQIIFGGGFIPLRDMSNEVFLAIAKFSPGDLITDAYRKCMLFDSISKISNELILMIVVALGAYLISITKVKFKWEE